jgi:peptidoglycan hydrolase CwlO-like protein
MLNILFKNKTKIVINLGIILSGLMLLFIFTGRPVSAATCDGNIDGKSDAELQTILAQCEAEIKAQQVVLDGQKTKSKTLQNEISTLQANINSASKKINEKNVVIKTLGNDISSKVQTISQLNTSISKGKNSLAQLLRKTNEIDNVNFASALLTAQSVSDFYSDVDSYSSVKKSVQISVEAIKTDKAKTEGVKQQLQNQQSQQIDAKAEIERQKSLVEKDKNTQNSLLSISKNKEAEYQKVLADRQAQASKIRAALFKLRGQGAIPFGDAYDYAKVASAKTGVKPAFILAVLKQESNLGANVGTCNRPGDARTWKDIMPGPNDNSWRDDQTVFLRITKALGISPEGQPLSCPLSTGGWGGAMGPAQFIPTTWEGVAPRIQSTLGVAVANPWNPQHAIMANALYMKDLGAAAGTYTAEREAACKYYSGRGCSAPGVVNAFYGNSVMAIEKDIQANIDILESI